MPDVEEIASFDSAIDLLLDVIDAAFAEGTLERVAQDGPLLHNGFTLQVAIARERDGLSRDIRRLTFVLQVMRARVFNGFNDLRRLVSKPLGKFPVSLLHLLVRDIQLGIARLVRRDLCGGRACSIRFGQVGFDLLATRAGGIEVLAGVAGDLGLTAATALDIVAQCLNRAASSERYTAVAYCCVRYSSRG